MSPQQLSRLRKLSYLFEEGIVGPKQIKELRDLLAEFDQKEKLQESTAPHILTDLNTAL